MPHIHPTAIVAPSARLADDVIIGPYCVVGEHVALADGVRLSSHVVVEGRTTVGERTRIFLIAATLGVYFVFAVTAAMHTHGRVGLGGSPLFYDFSAFYQAGAFADADLSLLQQLADRAALAIDNSVEQSHEFAAADVRAENGIHPAAHGGR